MKIRAFITHKKAEKYSDCADYFGICRQTKKVAVSDGVSQSIMPLEWAKILVRAYLEDGWEPTMDTAPLKDKWLKEANDYLAEQRARNINPWMLENCINNKDGAGATFCGITFLSANTWKASVLGDSCLVIVDQNNNISQIVSSKDGIFDNRPDYFDSFGDKYGVVKTIEGKLTDNQKLLLVSDPFSELFQKNADSVELQTILNKIFKIEDYEQYLQLVEDFRKYYKMHNDDSTLVIIEYDANEEFTILWEEKLEDLISKELVEDQERREEQNKEEETLWAKTLEINTIEAYETYISNSKLKLYKRDAKAKIQELINIEKDEEDWCKALKLNTYYSFYDYLSRHIDGIHIKEAKEHLKTLNPRTTERQNKEGDDTSESSTEDPVCSKNDCNIFTQETVECSDRFDFQNISQNSNSEIKTQFSSSEEIERCDMTKEDSSEGSTSLVDDEFSKNGELVDNHRRTEGALNCSEVPLYTIDRNRFHELLQPAKELFEKHIPSFTKAFEGSRKWRETPQSCFENFWIELEILIFDKKNG